MKYIVKNEEPEKLKKYRKTKNSTYSGFSNNNGKKDVKTELLKEQGYICAYCMKRIDIETIRIEHWKSQSEFPNLQLDYSNMLGVCEGIIDFTPNTENPDHLKNHCEKNRGNKQLTISPLNSNLIEQLKYTEKGLIFSDNENINNDLNENVLNLNIRTLKTNRAKIYEGVKFGLNIKAKNKLKINMVTEKNWFENDIKKELKKYSEKDSNQMFEPYCEIVNYFLKKALKKSE